MLVLKLYRSGYCYVVVNDLIQYMPKPCMSTIPTLFFMLVSKDCHKLQICFQRPNPWEKIPSNLGNSLSLLTPKSFEVFTLGGINEEDMEH